MSEEQKLPRLVSRLKIRFGDRRKISTEKDNVQVLGTHD